jgi:hypothetical protein
MRRLTSRHKEAAVDRHGSQRQVVPSARLALDELLEELLRRTRELCAALIPWEVADMPVAKHWTVDI